MKAPIWITIYWRGLHWQTVRCASDLEADHTVYHNAYYGRQCLKVKVKSWK